LKDGYYPIVVGGDQSQAIGSVSGMKSFMPDAKLISIDSQVGAKSQLMPLSYLCDADSNNAELGCVHSKREVCHFGVRPGQSQPEDTLVFDSKSCKSDQMTEIKK